LVILQFVFPKNLFHGKFSKQNNLSVFKDYCH